MVPTLFAIVTAGIYGIFELIIRRKERLAIIDKFSDKIDSSKLLENGAFLPLPKFNGFSFGTLRVAGFLIGMGLGIIVGFLAAKYLFCIDIYDSNYRIRELLWTVVGASIFVFGGLGLLVAFLVELKHNHSAKNKK